LESIILEKKLLERFQGTFEQEEKKLANLKKGQLKLLSEN
jgi:hypothetical protein